LIRDANDNLWRLFSNVAAQPGNTVNFTGLIYDDLILNKLYTDSIRLSGTPPSTATGAQGDQEGDIHIDSNYLYYCISDYVPLSYTVGWEGSTSNTLFLTKGDYPTPQAGWTVTYAEFGPYTIQTVTDNGTNWQITFDGNLGSPSGGTATLTNPTQSAIWKTVPLSAFQTAVSSNYSNANVVANLQNFVTSISTTANITTTANVIAPNYLFANGVNILSTVSGSYGNTQVAAYLLTYANANVANLNATSGNITTLVATNFSSGNIRVSGGYISALTNAAVTSATLTTAVATNFSTANAVITGGYATGLANITVASGGNIAGVGNIIGSTANTTITAGAYTSSFLNNGVMTTANVVASGNISALNFTGNGYQLTSVATKVLGSWTLSSGANTVNITVPGPGTYSLWVNGNIPNGICTYTATVVVTNNNVPVLGSQYAWYYLAGNALVLTSIPDHIVGTAGNIITTAPSTTTANVFEFGITNNSGASCTVDYGYTKLS
jgi:hypothetical protein